MVPALVLSLALLLSMASPTQAMPAPTKSQGCWEYPMLTGSDLPDPLPFGAAVPCPGIRPGAAVYIDEEGFCTLNFVFRGTSYDVEGRPVDEGLFIGTAGHCVNGDEHEQTWTAGNGPVASDASHLRFGQFAYSVMHISTSSSDKTIDFSLIRVDDAREAEVNPAMCHFGGPTGVSSSWTAGDIVHHFGQGLVYGDTVQARSGVVTMDYSGASALIFTGSVTPGDSGGPLIEADGDALGVIAGVIPPIVGATPIATQVERAEQHLQMDLDLVEGSFA